MKCPMCKTEMRKKEPEGYLVCPACNYECDVVSDEQYLPGEGGGLYEDLHSVYMVKAIISFIITLAITITLLFITSPLWLVIALSILSPIVQLYFVHCFVHMVIYKCIDRYHTNTVVKLAERGNHEAEQTTDLRARLDALEKTTRELRRQLAELKQKSDR